MFASRSPKFPERKRIKKSQTNGGLRSAFIQSVPAHCLATALAHMLHEFSSLIQTVTVGIGIPVFRSPIHALCHQRSLLTKARGLYRR